ncbi:MAG: B12-binding domain-containing protein [Oscillospiraceae bacterium]
MNDWKKQTVQSMTELNLDALHTSVLALADQGCSSQEIEALLQDGMRRVGKRFENGEYFLADLIVSGMMFKSALSLLRTDVPPRQKHPQHGRVLIGVVAGDIHDIGKDIVAQILQTEDFDILDLGVDVPAEAFVQAARDYDPDVIALSGVMVSSSKEMKRVLDALSEAGIHPLTPVVVGGYCVSDLVKDQIHADCYAHGPVDTMVFCKNVMERKRYYEQNR